MADCTAVKDEMDRLMAELVERQDAAFASGDGPEITAIGREIDVLGTLAIRLSLNEHEH